MARQEDRELQKRIDDLTEKLEARKRKTESYYEMEAELGKLYEQQDEIIGRQTNSKKAQVKVGQANLKISKEVESAKMTFQKYKWPTIDVSRKSVEETAASVIKIYEISKKNV